MPITDPVERALYQRKYWLENKEKRREKRLLTEHAYRETRLKKSTAQNRAKGHKPRTLKRALPEIPVSPQRKFRVFENLIYFSTLRGYTEAEVRSILKAVAELRKNQTNPAPDADEIPEPKASRQKPGPKKGSTKKPAAKKAPAARKKARA